jgi:hypothetical protein
VQHHPVGSPDPSSRMLTVLDPRSQSHICESVIMGGGFWGWGAEARSHGLVTGLNKELVGAFVLKVGGEPRSWS